MNKKLVTSLIALSVLGTSLFSFDHQVNATTLKNNDNPIVKPLGHYYATVIVAGGANIRSGPGTNYSIVTTASYGETLKLLQDSRIDSYGYQWLKVEKSNGLWGWIREDLVEVY